MLCLLVWWPAAVACLPGCRLLGWGNTTDAGGGGVDTRGDEEVRVEKKKTVEKNIK